jgi:hypothetical protein
MPLLDLKTNLKSLKYGNDRPGGGDSGQPYIKKPLYADPNKIPVGNGVVLASIHTLEDVSRLTKMFFDLKSPNGYLFTLNQNLLSRTGVKTQASGLINDGVYLPTNTLAQAGVSAAGLHFNKQGINPVPGTFGSRITYSDVINNEIDETKNSPDGILKNRLYALYETKMQDGSLGGFSKVTNVTSKDDQVDLILYPGGPGSVLGVGPTHIRFADQRTGINNINFKDKKEFFTGKYIPDASRDKTYFSLGTNISIPTSDYDNFLRFTRFNTLNASPTYEDNQMLIYNKISNDITNIVGRIKNFDYRNSPSPNFPNNTLVYTQENIISASLSINVSKDAPSYTPEIQDFRALLRTSINNTSTVMSDAPDYSNQNIETRVNIGGTLTKQGPGYKSGKNLYSYTNGSGIGPIDRLNAHPIYYSGNVDPNGNGNDPTSAPINDLVKFRIASINAGDPNFKTFMHFRAFLNSITDNYSAAWNSYNYVGRGEKFYSYGGFDRTLSLSWTVAAQSREELSPMYKKLNYLASTLAPSYSPSGYMRGPLVQLTIGGYVYEQVGFITGLTFEIGEDSPWEIGLPDGGINTATNEYDSKVKELPHYIRVSSFNFTPIHNFVPKTQNIKDWDGKSRFIALQDAAGNANTLYAKSPNPRKTKPKEQPYGLTTSGRIEEEIINLPPIDSQISNPSSDQLTLRGLDGLPIA